MIRRKGNKKAWILLLVMLALFCAWIPREQAKATTTGTQEKKEQKLKITEIDYEKETITIETIYGDTSLYYSDAKQKNWECASGHFVEKTRADGKTKYWEYVLDISWIKKTKDYVLTLKGDQSYTVVSVTLPKQQTNFKVTLDYTTGTLKYTNHMNKDAAVFWRKNNSTIWYEVNDSTCSTLQRFYARGVSLYFRIGQIKGKLQGNELEVGSRPSKEVKMSVVKQASAPSVSITTATQVLSLPALLQYQVYVGNKLDGDWTTASNKKLSIPKDVAKAAYISGSGNNVVSAQEVKVVFRTAATAKKPASMEKTITIKPQESIDALSNVRVKIASSEVLSIEIADSTTGTGENQKVQEGASSTNPYEYTIVIPEVPEDLERAVWKTITSQSGVMLKQSIVPEGSTIYIRKKAHIASDDKTVYYPESQCYYYKVGAFDRGATKVDLVEDSPTANAYKENNTIYLVKEEEGDSSSLKFVIKPDMGGSGSNTGSSDSNNSNQEFTELKVDKIYCNNQELVFEAKTDESTDNILITITPSPTFETSVLGNTAYPLVITLNNGEVLNGDVMLTILKKTYLKQECVLNIIAGVKYDKSPTTGYSDVSPYRFTIVPKKVLTGIGGVFNVAKVKSVSLEGETIDFREVPNTVDGTSEVILNEEELEKVFDDHKLEWDKKYKLTITMQDSDAANAKTETINSGVEVVRTKEAVLVGTTWTNYGKILGENFEKDLEIKMAYKTPGISISSVHLVYNESNNGSIALPGNNTAPDNMDIRGNCYIDSEYVYITLSKNKLNKIEIPAITSGPSKTLTYEIVITFSNGAIINTGLTITFSK